MLRNGFTRFCDDPEIACCKAEKELEQLRAELTELKALAQAKVDGRLIVLPCKVGDTVYWADNDVEIMCCIHTGVVGAFSVDNEEGKLWCYVRYDDGLRYHHRVDAFFGKTVFLTREAAEKAIAEVGRYETNPV